MIGRKSYVLLQYKVQKKYKIFMLQSKNFYIECYRVNEEVLVRYYIVKKFFGYLKKCR